MTCVKGQGFFLHYEKKEGLVWHLDKVRDILVF